MLWWLKATDIGVRLDFHQKNIKKHISFTDASQKNTTKLRTHSPISCTNEAKENQIGWQGLVWTVISNKPPHDYQNCGGQKKNVLLWRLSSRSLSVGGRVNKMSSIIDSECSEQSCVCTHTRTRAHTHKLPILQTGLPTARLLHTLRFTVLTNRLW